jgi:hypothetical protein
MSNQFFEQPILNSPYEYPNRHWELDKDGQPTQKTIDERRRAEFTTPIPKPKKRKDSAKQQQIIFDEGEGLSTQQQAYDPTPIIELWCYDVRFNLAPTNTPAALINGNTKGAQLGQYAFCAASIDGTSPARTKCSFA